VLNVTGDLVVAACVAGRGEPASDAATERSSPDP